MLILSSQGCSVVNSLAPYLGSPGARDYRSRAWAKAMLPSDYYQSFALDRSGLWTDPSTNSAGTPELFRIDGHSLPETAQ
ncbi:MAG: hypothetical protein MUQ76_11165 [Reinekea forsetii]|nr:hypothetical protein [Reinekea forsetii]